MPRTITAFFLTLACVLASAQAGSSGRWLDYTAFYASGPGATRVDLGLRERAPVPGFEYLVVTGTRYATGHANGMPEVTDLIRLNKLAGKVVRAIQTISPAIYAGSFTHNGEQLHYVYVKDPATVEGVLASTYREACGACETSIKVQPDASWKVYLKFLYPRHDTPEPEGRRSNPAGV